MQLRAHPKMVYCAIRAWPPQWGAAIPSAGAKLPVGEEGTLVEVRKVEDDVSPSDEPHLMLKCDFLGRRFSANLYLDDPDFLLNVVYEELRNCIGRPLDQVGACPLPDK